MPRFWPAPPEDCTRPAQAIFADFAARHDLAFTAAVGTPMELLWDFPEQPGLAHPITLCLSNGDELSFGVGDFWSYFFPFADVKDLFEAVLDAWMEGRARIAVYRGRKRTLEMREGEGWRVAYTANPNPLRRQPVRYLINRP